MRSKRSTDFEGHAGDAIEIRGIHGQPARHGMIVEAIGQPMHRRYRVSWEDDHESIVYPADGVMIVPRAAASHAARPATAGAATAHQ
ncbi:MAG: DUF1918 domain-containing protein [Solirubrobacteraceae bacterium]